jgi:lactoylglutathione lyase
MPVSAIVYVNDVVASLDFYEAFLGVPPHHVHDDGSYGELHHAGTRIGFAPNWLAERNLDSRFRTNDPAEAPAGFELYFVVDDVDGAFERALRAGAISVWTPEDKGWGRVAMIRDPDGVLVQIGEG